MDPFDLPILSAILLVGLLLNVFVLENSFPEVGVSAR